MMEGFRLRNQLPMRQHADKPLLQKNVTRTQSTLLSLDVYS